MKEKRDWLDYAGTLLLPLVLALVGWYHTWQDDRAKTEEQNYDRSTQILKMAVSSEEQQRLAGIAMMETLKTKGRLPHEFEAVLGVLKANGRPSDKTVQAATQALQADQKAASGPAAAPSPSASATKAPVPAFAGPVPVYIQIAREDQRKAALALAEQLNAVGSGYTAPGVELVQTPTVHTYVRYFKNNKNDAVAVRSMMARLGVAADIQDFSRSFPTSTPQVEVWIGSSE